MIFHIDANSFYASCERMFRPDLYDRPIAVLSNNDGIVIALNRECKDRGFARGDAFFKIRERMESEGVAVFSSNYTLYADISSRLNAVYMRMSEDIEIYSIDESFLYFPEWKTSDLVEIGHEIKNTVAREIGMPVSIGIAPSKTLAKLCNKLAKKRGGICCWDELDKDRELAAYPVQDIWGIGPSKADTLAMHGIETTLDLKRYPLHLAKKHLTITGLRTVQELNGIPAIDCIEQEARKNICSSKSFASPVFELDELKVALADYTQEAVKRMREEESACRFVSVYLMTNPWSDVGEQYFNSASAEMPRASSYLPDILGVALELLASIYRSGFRYRKVMINLLGLQHDSTDQLDLFETFGDKKKEDAIMKAFDTINDKYGRGTIRMGTRSLLSDTDTESKDRNWRMKREFLSPEYTTRLTDLPRVN
jgi:DNA polymerase V